MSASQPRRQHYDFAHRLLPKLVGENADRVLDILAGEQGESFLEQMWRFAGEGVPEGARIAERPVRHVRHLPIGRMAVVLALPSPAAITEAYFVAVVSTAPKGARYFTLELGVDFPSDEPRTVLCEWSGGSHVNFGTGPAADLAAFLDAVEAQVSPRQ